MRDVEASSFASGCRTFRQGCRRLLSSRAKAARYAVSAEVQKADGGALPLSGGATERGRRQFPEERVVSPTKSSEFPEAVPHSVLSHGCRGWGGLAQDPPRQMHPTQQ